VVAQCSEASARGCGTLARVELRVGTSGFSYKEWRGSFYPEKLAADEMLRYYAERRPTVEVNNTFYRLPRTSVLEGWAGQVPEHFRFALKASRRITHFRRLRDAGDETAYLLRTTSALGSRLGALLFQLPPNLPKDLPRLEAFLALLPEGTRAAFEFRSPSWFDDDTFERLRARGMALCIADRGEDGEPETPVVATGPFGYLRLRRERYTPADLAAWAERIRAQPWQEAFAYFTHELEGPGLATQLTELFEHAATGSLRSAPARRGSGGRRSRRGASGST
jgi:uncharacterized protein YecE (DUF72 family)